MSPIAFRHVDSFTTVPLGGNPAAVFLLPTARDTAWCQSIAAEMMVPDTAFLVPPVAPADGGAPGAWGLRWFTPTDEVDLCGHATLASAHVLWEDGLAAPGSAIHFDTRSGPLSATLRAGGIVELDLPAEPVDPIAADADVTAAIGALPGRYSRGRTFLVAELESEGAVSGLRPDLGRLAVATGAPLAVTARSDGDGFDYVCRIFAPAIGIPEDPVTGSAQCALGPYWAVILGKQDLRGRQLSARGGEVAVAVRGDRVLVGGPAVTIVRGEILD